MKKTLCILLSVILIFSSIVLPVYAEEDAIEPLPEFNYYYNDGETIIIRAYNGTEENVIIPEEIDGFRVVAISNNTFTSEDNIKSVTIPACVTSIDTRAFNAVDSLERVEFLSDGVRNLSIDTGAFFSCSSLSEIILPSEKIYSVCSQAFWKSAYVNNTDNWEGNALYLNDILLTTNAVELAENYVVKEGTTVIANEIFTVLDEKSQTATRHFKNIILPQSIKVIGSYNFMNLENLSDSLERIGLLGEMNGLEFTVDTISKSDTYIAKVNSTGYVPTKDLHVELIKDGWLLSATPMSILTEDLVRDQMYIIPEGVEHLADDYDLILNDLPGKLYSIKYSEYVIFPSTLKSLPLENPLYNNFDNILFGIICNSVTFLDKDTVIYDSPNTISPLVEYICGYSGSTAEAYAKKYDREFIDIENCTHEVTAIRGAIANTCERSGYSGDTYCGHCGTFITKGTVTDPHYLYETISPASYPCEDTMASYSCAYCDYETAEIVYKPGLGHIDEDFDGECDYCWDYSEKAKSCTCKVCRMHIRDDDSFFEQIIPIIIVSIWRLFRIKEFCDNCGLRHWNR